MIDSGSNIWTLDPRAWEATNLAKVMRRLGTATYEEFLHLSVAHPERYWDATLEHMGIRFEPEAQAFLDVSAGAPWARPFPGAGFNFAAQCLSPSTEVPERLAISWEDESGSRAAVSYAELAHRTRRFADGLRQLGVQPGDRVGFLFNNSAEAVISFLAVAYIGAVIVPLYSGYGAEAVARRLRDAEVSCLVMSHGFYRRGRYVSLTSLVDEVRTHVPELETLIVAHGNEVAAPTIDHHSWHAVESSGSADAIPERTQAIDPFMIIYTSGTTGRPKGAVHLHGGFPLRVAQDVAFLFDFKAGDRYFWMSDMGWMVGPFSMCATFLLKGTLVLYDGAPDVPNVGRLRSVACRHRVTHFGSSPTAMRMMASDESATFATPAVDLRVLMTGGEVIDAETFDWFFNRFGGGRLPIINYTGGTEVSGAILTNVLCRPIAPSCFNSMAPGVNARVVDESGQAMEGIPGELAILQPFVGMTNGFWKDPERYLQTYWQRIAGMWLHGDLAVHEQGGQYRLIGRSDDVMKISGRRVGPAEIEGTLIDGNIVLDAVAFGVPDLRSGEALVILVVAVVPDATPDSLESHVAIRLRASMGPAFRPAAVVGVRRLVKTRNGKLVRRLARQAWLGQAPGDLTAVEDPTVFEDLVHECIRYRNGKSGLQSGTRHAKASE